MTDIQNRMAGIKHKILVLSGKGGVGKSTVATQLAWSLRRDGKKVGLLDVDICGPSVPKMTGLQGKEIMQGTEGWIPVFADAEQRLCVMSIGFMLPSTDFAVAWRGPKKDSMIKQFLSDTIWGTLDYLVIDTPPGTSDEHISITQYLKESSLDGAVIVTTPQAVSIVDVRKEIAFCNKVGVKVLGIVENMSGFVCPNCSECTNLFLSGGGKALAEELSLPFLGTIPIDPQVGACAEQGQDLTAFCPASPATMAFSNIAEKVVSSCSQ